MQIFLYLLLLNLAHTGLVPRDPRVAVAQPIVRSEISNSCKDVLKAHQRAAGKSPKLTLNHPHAPIKFLLFKSPAHTSLERLIEPEPREVARNRQSSAVKGKHDEPFDLFKELRDHLSRTHDVFVMLAQNADAMELRRFIQRSREKFARNPHDLDSDLDSVEVHYTQNGGYFLVLKELEYGNIVGTAAVYHLGNGRAEIRKFYLDEKFQKRGLGRDILEHLLSWCREQQYSTVATEVYSNMTAARRLYESMGFQPIQPPRIQRENAKIDDHDQKIMAYANFLTFQKRRGPSIPIQQNYHSQYVNYFNLKFDSQFPPHHEFIERTLGLYMDLEMEPKDWILPAIVLKRKVRNGRTEFHVMTPGLHPWPEKEGYEIADVIPDELLPAMAMLGFLPFNSIRDLQRFIALAAQPAFMQSLAKVVHYYAQQGRRASFLTERRFGYALESLVLADPSKKAALSSFLKVPQQEGKKDQPIPFDAFYRYFHALSTSQIFEHAEFLSSRYQDYLIFYGASGFDAVERALEAKKIWEMYHQPESLTVFLERFSGTPAFNLNLHLPEEAYWENPAFWGTRLSLLLHHYRSLSMAESQENAIEAQLRTLLARMEYFAWNTAVVVNYAQWSVDMLYSASENSSLTMDLIKNAFGERSVTYRMFFN